MQILVAKLVVPRRADFGQHENATMSASTAPNPVSRKAAQHGKPRTWSSAQSAKDTASKQSVIGGGSKIARPGEITHAQLRVLLLYEIAEFSQLKSVIASGVTPPRLVIAVGMGIAEQTSASPDAFTCEEKEICSTYFIHELSGSQQSLHVSGCS